MTEKLNTLSRSEIKRRQLQEEAYSIGVTEAFIREVVTVFYGKIRKHPLLGPIFEERIGDNWGTHIDTMERFWCSVTLNYGTYSGKPVQSHVAIPRISPQQFSVWLGLFGQTLAELAPSPEAQEHMMIRAERMSGTLEKAIRKRDGVLDAA